MLGAQTQNARIEGLMRAQFGLGGAIFIFYCGRSQRHPRRRPSLSTLTYSGAGDNQIVHASGEHTMSAP